MHKDPKTKVTPNDWNKGRECFQLSNTAINLPKNKIRMNLKFLTEIGNGL